MADEEKKKSGGFGSKLLKVVLILAFYFVAALVATGYISGKREISEIIDINNITDQYFLLIFGLLTLLTFLWWLTKIGDKNDESSGAKITTKGKVKKYYDTNWLTEEELLKNPVYNYNVYENLKNFNKVGIPIRAEFKNGKLHVNMFGPIHALVIGSTGAGKTTQFVDPMMQILSETGKHPCLVVSDPKGEILSFHGNKLKRLGYRILVFDLHDPFKSTCWNPLARPYDLNYEACHLYDKVKTHNGDDPRHTNLVLASKMFYSEWWEIDGYAFGHLHYVFLLCHINGKPHS